MKSKVVKVGSFIYFHRSEKIKARQLSLEDLEALFGRKTDEFYELIIATDNFKLNSKKDWGAHNIPKIPQSFIEAYNKLGGIHEVELETETDSEEHPELTGNPKETWEVLKLTENNEVIINNLKEIVTQIGRNISQDEDYDIEDLRHG